MTNVLKAAVDSTRPSTIEHTLLESVPQAALQLELLKSFERQLNSQGIITTTPGGSPLWFLAETERNVTLWRNGLSIAHAGLYEFWVDIPALITKRRQKLREYDADNPFHAEGWRELLYGEATESEEDYLASVESLLSHTLPHCHALCKATRLVEEERTPRETLPPIVVLPATISRVHK